MLAPAGVGNHLMVLLGGVDLCVRVLAVRGASHLMLADFFVSAPAGGLAPVSFDGVVDCGMWCCLMVRSRAMRLLRSSL